MLPFPQYSRYWQTLLALPTQDEYFRAQLCDKDFLISSDRGLNIYYAPFHFLNANARIILLGITPGWTQMELSFRAAKRGVANGLEGERLFEYIARIASFGGQQMRRNLVETLDGVELNKCFGIKSCTDLFVEGNHLAHFTCVVTAPIFRAGENYRGLSPEMLRVSALRSFILEHLVEELSALPHAIIVPLGKVPSQAMQFLHEKGLLSLDRCLNGFPHPSGANNGRRRSIFELGREHWKQQIEEWFTYNDSR
jgi:hypothetical protein